MYVHFEDRVNCAYLCAEKNNSNDELKALASEVKKKHPSAEELERLVLGSACGILCSPRSAPAAAQTLLNLRNFLNEPEIASFYNSGLKRVMEELGRQHGVLAAKVILQERRNTLNCSGVGTEKAVADTAMPGGGNYFFD